MLLSTVRGYRSLVRMLARKNRVWVNGVPEASLPCCYPTMFVQRHKSMITKVTQLESEDKQTKHGEMYNMGWGIGIC